MMETQRCDAERLHLDATTSAPGHPGDNARLTPPSR